MQAHLRKVEQGKTSPTRATETAKAGKGKTMKVYYRERNYIGDYKAIDTEKSITIDRAWNVGGLLYGYKNRFEVVAVSREDVLRVDLPQIVYTWADMVNAIITPAGGDMFTVDTPESLDTMTAAALVDLARADMVKIVKRYAERGETL